MKQIFYTGLLALTVAFGVTSCDKNELPDAPAVGVVVNDEYSKVSFGELDNGIVVKGASNEAGKTAGEFDHIYASTPQILEISKGGEVLYTGSYDAGNISSLNPAEIILANGSDYVATSSNASNDALGVVAGFLPYTSTIGFDLSASGSIQLQASLERAFLIVNVEDALEGSRISGARIRNIDLEVGADLLVDSRDSFGDYFGYIEAGNYVVSVSYLLDGQSVTMSGETLVVANGSAYTITLNLAGNAPASSDTTTSTESSTEAELDAAALALYSNNDEDLLDSISRIVSSTIITTDGVPGAPSLEKGDWSIVSNINVSASTVTATSTEADEQVNVNSDSGDTDMYDLIQREVTTTITSTDGTEVSVPSYGEWSLLLDRNSLTVGEDGTNPGDSSTTDPVYVARVYSAYAPAFTDQIANFSQTRTVSNEGASFDPAIVEESLTNAVIVSSTGGVESTENSDEATLGRSINLDGDLLDTITRQVTSDEVYTASVDGTHTVVTANGSWSIVTDNAEAITYDVREYSAYGPGFTTQIEDFTQTRSVSNAEGSTFDPNVAVGELSRVIVVGYEVTTAPLAGVIGVGTYTATIDGSIMIHTVDIAALPPVAATWGDVDGVWSNSDYAGYSFTVAPVPVLGGFSSSVVNPSGASGSNIAQAFGGATEAIAIANMQAEIARAFAGN